MKDKLLTCMNKSTPFFENLTRLESSSGNH